MLLLAANVEMMALMALMEVLVEDRVRNSVEDKEDGWSSV
jgi:hypothetical protein